MIVIAPDVHLGVVDGLVDEFDEEHSQPKSQNGVYQNQLEQPEEICVAHQLLKSIENRQEVHYSE